jgi:hypothetical protein
MTALRCTAKLLKAMKATPEVSLQPARNRLGEWTANLIRVGRVQLVIAVSEPTRMGVAIDAAPYASVPSRLCDALLAALLDLGIEPADALAEIGSMLPLQIAVTSSRSVLSAVNQYAWQAECGVYSRGARSAAAATRDFADMVVLKPEHIGFPADRVREAFGLPPREPRRWTAADSELH